MTLISQSNDSFFNSIQAVPLVFSAQNLSAPVVLSPIFAPTISKLFRVLVYLKVSRKATTSSTLGGTTGVVLGYTNPYDNTTQTLVMLCGQEDGQPNFKNQSNTVNTKLQGTAMIVAKTGVPITLSIGYASTGATPMLYDAQVIVETL